MSEKLHEKYDDISLFQTEPLLRFVCISLPTCNISNDAINDVIGLFKIER